MTAQKINVGDTVTYEPCGCAARDGTVLRFDPKALFEVVVTDDFCPEEPWNIYLNEITHVNGVPFVREART